MSHKKLIIIIINLWMSEWLLKALCRTRMHLNSSNKIAALKSPLESLTCPFEFMDQQTAFVQSSEYKK